MTDPYRPDALLSRDALDWTIRSQDPSFDDWDGLTSWLGSDARHAAEFERISQWDREFSGVLRSGTAAEPALSLVAPRAEPPNGDPRRPYHRTLLPLAASLVLGIAAVDGGWLMLSERHSAQTGEPAWNELVTQDAQRKDVRLADGTRISVGPQSRLQVRPDGRSVKLESGQAFFSVRHDSIRPFVIDAGALTVTDLGTVFDVKRRGNEVAIGVAEGAVRIGGLTPSIMLTKGRELTLAGNRAAEREVDPAVVGGWREGRYTYQDATVGDVVDDIARVTGSAISATPALRREAFAGSLRIDPDAGRTLRELAPALGMTAVKVGGTWQLDASRPSGGR